MRSSSLVADFGHEMVQAYAVNDRMNQLILEHLDPRAWRAQPPGGGRTIAAIFAHVHNIRCKWLRLSAPHLGVPKRLDRARSTQTQTSAALAESAARCCEMLAEALIVSQSGGATTKAGLHHRAERRVQSFLRDGWARPWRPGAAMFAYMVAHDTHHRGQVCLLAHQLGFPLPFQAGPGIWAWEKLWKQCGFKLAGGQRKCPR